MESLPKKDNRGVEQPVSMSSIKGRPSNENAQEIMNTIEYKQLVNDIGSCSTTLDKLTVIIGTVFPENKQKYSEYGSSIVKNMISSFENPFSDSKLRNEIKEKFESLRLPSELDSFLSELWIKCFSGVDEKEKNSLMGHWVSNLLVEILNGYIRKLPTDSSGLDMWYIVGKHFWQSSDIFSRIRIVYKKNINDPKSKSFFKGYIEPNEFLREYFTS
ncbi:MAG: hypothetical protein WCO48_00665 [Candidatus Taylorbacteria bacterium]